MSLNGEVSTVAHDETGESFVEVRTVEKFLRRCKSSITFEHDQKALGVIRAFFFSSPVNLDTAETIL